MNRKILATIALSLLTACAAQQHMWHHPTSNQAQFDSDKALCLYAAAMASGSYAPNNPGYRTAFGKAMADRMDTDSRRNELAVLCLQSRGYYLKQIP